MYPDARKSSTVDLLTPTPNLTLYSSFTPSIKLTATTETVEYRPRTRAERAAEPHTATRPNWALAPTQRPVFTKEPGPRHSISNPSLPKYPLPPSQPLLGLNLVNYGAPSINENDCSPAPLEKPIATSPPHDATEPPLCKPPAPSVHPSRLRLLRSSGAPSEAGFGHAETKTQTAAGSLNEEITGANTVPVAKMRKWGAGATEGACTETSASGNIDEKGAMRSKVPWVDKDPPPHSAATIDTVPIGSKTVASARIPVQAATRPTPTKRQPCPVIIEPESGDDADRPTPSPSSQLSHIDNNLSVPAPSAPSLVLPSALRQRNVAEHPYEPPNPFMDQEPTQESVSIDKPRLPLLQRMGIGARVGPSALAARQKLFIEEGGRMYDDAYQCANEEAYEEYDEEEYRTPPWARTKKVVIAEPVGREERVELTPPIRTPAKRVVRIAELGPPSRVQTRRRRVIRYQEGDQGEVGECEVTYDQYLQEDPHIGTAAGRRIPVSQTEHNPPPRASAAIQQDSPRHIVGSRARRVVIQAPLEADSVDKVVERFRGLSVAGRVQTPGPRRHKVMKVQYATSHYLSTRKIG